MRKLSRRKLLTAGLAAAGVPALGVAARMANRYGLIPPDHGGLYGPGQTLTYAAQRLLTRNALAREFSPRDISTPCVNGTPPKSEDFQRLQAGGFAEWRIQLDGMVSRPGPYLLSEIKKLPSRSQITHLACEEGWSFIAEWTGLPLAHLLEAAGTLPQAKYVVYFSMDPKDPNTPESIDMIEALHPQTLLTYGMNGGDPACAAWRPDTATRPAPTRLQEYEVPYARNSYGHAKGVRRAPGLGECRRRLSMVRWHLISYAELPSLSRVDA